MAVDFYIKQGDTAPAIIAVLQDAHSTVVDLSGTTCRFVMSDKLSGARVIDSPGSVIDPVNGVVQYQWQTGDTDLAAKYNAEFEIRWGDGTFETFPNSKYIVVQIVKDLGGAVG